MPTPIKYTLGILVTLGGLFCVLAFGNVQWKYCYMFQAYVWPAQPDTESWYAIDVTPDNFTGVWRSWHRNGELHRVGSYLNKQRIGIHFRYGSDGKPLEINKWEAGQRYPIQIFDSLNNIDRRAEFGIEVEK